MPLFVMPDMTQTTMAILDHSQEKLAQKLSSFHHILSISICFKFFCSDDFLIQMAALSALRNRNSQKMREGFESFLAKCVESSENRNEVDLIYVVNTMEENNIKLEPKETSRLEKICDNHNKINR